MLLLFSCARSRRNFSKYLKIFVCFVFDSLHMFGYYSGIASSTHQTCLPFSINSAVTILLVAYLIVKMQTKTGGDGTLPQLFVQFPLWPGRDRLIVGFASECRWKNFREETMNKQFCFALIFFSILCVCVGVQRICTFTCVYMIIFLFIFTYICLFDIVNMGAFCCTSSEF